MKVLASVACLALLTGCVEDEGTGSAQLSGGGIAATPILLIAAVAIAIAIFAYRRWRRR